LTRGDSAEFRPVIADYEAQEGDTIIFAMKKALNDAEPTLRIEVPVGDNIVFTPETTSNLTPGTYLYDLRIKTIAGDVSTFVNAKRFNLLGEIDNEKRD
jgi:hypothetical protein